MFNRSKKRGAADKQPLLVLQSPTGMSALAFGVTWRTILSADATAKEALKFARADGASHINFRGSQYGYGLVNPADDSGLIYPAASLVARQHGGDAIYFLHESAGQEYWLAQTHDGLPTPTDRVLRGLSEDSAKEQFHDLLKKAVESGATPQVFTNVFTSGDIAVPIRVLSFEELAGYSGASEFELSPLAKQKTSIPKPILYSAAAIVMILVANEAWSRYSRHKAKELARLQAADQQDPREAWEQALRRWYGEHAAPSVAGLTLARTALGTVPVVLNGWVLNSAICSAGPLSSTVQPFVNALKVEPPSLDEPAIAPPPPALGPTETAIEGAISPVAEKAPSFKRTWACNALYARPQTGSLNRQMVGTFPVGWTVQFDGLTNLSASWSFNEGTNGLSLETMKKVDYHQTETASRLQTLLPGFMSPPTFKFVPVVIPAPKKSDGTLLPPTDNVPNLRSVSLELNGPLRTMDALIANAPEADWTEISLSRGKVNGSDLRVSGILAAVKGTIYAKQ